MSADNLYYVANAAVVPAWLLLIIVPRWRHTQRIALITGVTLALFYTVTLAATLGHGDGDMFSLAGVQRGFAQPWVLLYAWAHYLVFDLFVGAWEVREAQRLGLPHAAVVPCLLFTLILGPVGFLSFLGLRAGARRRFWIASPAGRPTD